MKNNPTVTSDSKFFVKVVRVVSVVFALFCVDIGVLSAEMLPIVHYDVENTPVSGFGCWNHSYDGTITDTGRTVGGSVICPAGAIGHVLNYTGGSGSLNDGQVSETHLLLTRKDDAGEDLKPVIKLYLNGPHKIDQIRLLKGDFSFTTITGFTVEINGTAIPFAAVPISNDPLSVTVDLKGSLLNAQPTDVVVLRDFSASFYGSEIDQFGIGEITVDGTAAISVPTNIGQCRRNGWKSFGFRNQGQCIRYVITSKIEDFREELRDEILH